MKKMMEKIGNAIYKFFEVMLLACGWILAGLVSYLIVFEGVRFSVDFTTIDAAVDTLGCMMICVIPTLAMIVTFCKYVKKLHNLKEDVKTVDEYYQIRLKRMIMDAKLG